VVVVVRSKCKWKAEVESNSKSPLLMVVVMAVAGRWRWWLVEVVMLLVAAGRVVVVMELGYCHNMWSTLCMQSGTASLTLALLRILLRVVA
jgi:hypothetical protein